MAWVAAVAALAAAAVSTYNTNKTNKKRDAALSANLRTQRGIQDRSNRAIQGAVSDLERSRAADAKQRASKRYLAALGRAGGGGQITGANPLGKGKAYTDALRAAAANESDFAAESADLYAATDAPGDQRMAEAFSFGDLGTRLGLFGSESRGAAGIGNLKLGQIRRDPYLDLAAAAMQGFGSAYSSGGGGGGGAAGAGGG